MLYQSANPHGGDLFGYDIKLDFSVNTNPLGTPKTVMQAVVDSASQLCRYPDPQCRELVAALAKYEGVPEEFVLCGCGAAELIYAYCGVMGGGKALLTAPTFSEYAAALEAAGGKADFFSLREEDGFAVSELFLQELEETSCKVVFLCNPNNPTGRLISSPVLQEICEICKRRGIRLFVDECFLDLSDVGREASLVHLLGEFPDLFILKAFTKSYGMAGLRLGYCLCGDRALLAAMGRRAQPWNVSLPAQAAGVTALKEQAFLEEARKLIAQERRFLSMNLEKLSFKVYPSQANYLLLKSDVPIFEPLRDRGILIRDCSNYAGLDAGFYRVAVKRREENQLLVEALSDICAHVQNRALGVRR